MAKSASATYTAKTAQLAAKMARSRVAFDKATAECDFNKVSGPERAGYIAFAATAMHDTQYRGAIAKAILAPGVSRSFTFKEIAKMAGVDISEITKVNLRYIAENVRKRVALVGFAVSFEWDEKTVSVKKVSAKAKSKPTAPRKPKTQVEVVSGETEAA
jgi:hypothetical protein